MYDFFKKIHYLLPKRFRVLVMMGYNPYLRVIGFARFHFFKFLLKDKKINKINAFEQKIYSQNGEDGILKIIFYKIGVRNKFCVEFGVTDGKECNTRYFIDKKHWSYVHMDGMDISDKHTDIKKEFITAENINDLFLKYKVPEDFDLLSIDVDFNTYWIWKALSDKYKPRVVVIEYNADISPLESSAVAYDPKGVWDGETQYYGGSLLALVRIGKLKGYTLVGCDNQGVNAFFVKDELVNSNFVNHEITDLYRPPLYGKKINGKYGYLPSKKSLVSV